MRGRILLTDYHWFEYLRDHGPFEEVNFWRPSAKSTPRISVGTPILFKMHQPQGGMIGGYGLFARHDIVPVWLAWEVFQTGNGAPNPTIMRSQIESYRAKSGAIAAAGAGDYLIGCTVLAQPVFLDRPAWVKPPAGWPSGVQVGKDYDLDRGEGARVWQDLQATSAIVRGGASLSGSLVFPEARYGSPSVIQPRLGQGAFRLAVTAAYDRACAVTGEHSLPALEAAHIRPYADEGTHEVSNGILLRSDIHRLFDMGYVGVTPDHRFVVSKALKNDFENGRSYYPLHGQSIGLPSGAGDRPAFQHIEWHLSSRFRQ
jgi:putative restriction endonuclease